MGVPCVGIRNNITPPNIWSYSDRGKITDLVINPTLIVDDAAKARDAVLNNGGVSWNFDVLMSSALDRGEVVELFSSQFSTKEMGYICFEHSKHLSDSEKLFIDCLHQYYQVQSTTKEEHFDNALLV
jgi:DNA-binding transcriptional LysR family regulator